MVGRGGELSALDWCLNIEKTVSEEHAVTKERFLWFCSGLYHESRHGEQWFRCAHGVVRGELTNRWLDGTAPQRLPEHVARMMLLPRAVVEAAEARGGASWAAYRREQAVEAWFDSIWGIARGWRGRVLAHPDLMVDGTAAHARYLALPEEVDAYALQHAIEAQMDPLLPADPPQAPPLPAIAVRQVAIQPPVSALDAQIRAVQLRHVPMEDRSYETSAVRRLVAAHAALIARQ